MLAEPSIRPKVVTSAEGSFQMMMTPLPSQLPALPLSVTVQLKEPAP